MQLFHTVFLLGSLFSLTEHDSVCVCVILNFTKIKAAAQFSRDTEVNGADEATVSPTANREQQEIVRKKILDNQYKCFEKMNRDPPYNKSGNKNIK